MNRFLASTPWQNAEVTPIAGDASARRYFRLSNPVAILMVDPNNQTTSFADIARALYEVGLSAPEIFHHDPVNGVMVIEDLGATDFSDHIQKNPDDSQDLYQAATDVLIDLVGFLPNVDLPKMTHPIAAEMIGLAAQHYGCDPTTKAELCAAMKEAFDQNVDPSLSFAMRDYHAENLIWRPDQSGLKRVGLLDFQDACFAPLGYDLMSLLRDARRDVDEDIIQGSISQFCSAIDRNVNDLSAHLASVGAQRNLRILGIFARLAEQDGKTQYLSLLPRVWRCLMADLAHPALKDLQETVMRLLPPPDDKTLKRLSQ